eukprot:scaffold4480_cov57-Phaeocystis_antarctica.AAC.1
MGLQPVMHGVTAGARVAHRRHGLQYRRSLQCPGLRRRAALRAVPARPGAAAAAPKEEEGRHPSGGCGSWAHLRAEGVQAAKGVG